MGNKTVISCLFAVKSSCYPSLPSALCNGASVCPWHLGVIVFTILQSTNRHEITVNYVPSLKIQEEFIEWGAIHILSIFDL